MITRQEKISIVFVEPSAKLNAEYYRDSILNVLIQEMDGLARRKPYLFMQDGARFHTAQSTIEMLRSQTTLGAAGTEYVAHKQPRSEPSGLFYMGGLGGESVPWWSMHDQLK